MLKIIANNQTIMNKKHLILTFLFVFGLIINGFSQMKFMGISMDCEKNDMISQLEQSGFSPVARIKAKELWEEERNTPNNQRLRYNDSEYTMTGYFDGKECTLSIFSYKSNIYKIEVTFDDTFKYKSDAYAAFNHYAEMLQDKYHNRDNIYDPLDEDDEINPDVRYRNVFLNKRNNGSVILTLTHTRNNIEKLLGNDEQYHMFLTYENNDNKPDGEDL